MAQYRPASAFGWLDIDEAASERTATLLKAFEESSTLDPIGLGPVRDAFSELFFPGTSTIQTRLRYFLFTPWICLGLERDGVRPAEFAGALRDREARLIDCLRHLGRNHGVIGRISGSDLRRMPSQAYWGGLGSWGIRQLDLSIAEYGRRIDSFRSARLEVDDDHNPVVRGEAMWAALPDPPDDFLQADTDMALTFDEADFVVERITHRHPESLLAELMAVPAQAAEAPMPWDVPNDSLSPRMREWVRHARAVSELTIGVQELYNLLLAERAATELSWDTSALQEAIRNDLADWVDEVDGSPDLGTWVDQDLGEFWSIVEQVGAVSKPTRDFVTHAVELSVANPAGLAEHAELKQLVADRERLLKGSRARLGLRSALESWDQSRFGGQLEYRWSTVRSYFGDVARALGDQKVAA